MKNLIDAHKKELQDKENDIIQRESQNSFVKEQLDLKLKLQGSDIENKNS